MFANAKVMTLKFKNNFFGYFNFYYSVLGNKILLNFGLCILISFLDGIGLAMFIPLLQNVSTVKHQPIGQLHYLTDFIERMGFPLTLNTVLIILVSLFVLKGIIKFLQLNYQLGLRTLFMKKVRYSLVNQLQGISYTGFLKLDAGRIQNTLVGEVQKLLPTMNFYFNAAQSSVMLFTYVVLAILANYQFSLLIAIGSALSNIIYRKMYIATKKSSVLVSKKGNEFNKLSLQSIHYFKYLKSTNTFHNFALKLKHVIKETEILNKRMGFFTAVSTSVKEPIIIIIVAFVIYIEVTWLGASLTSIMLSLLLFYRALSYLMVIQNFWQSFIQNIGAMNSVATISHEMLHMQEMQKEKTFLQFQLNLNIEAVSFCYGTNEVLNNININISKNTTIALVGESGSGKTTLANLIAGLIQPTKGQFIVDDVPISNYNLDSFRSTIGYISQESVIFNDTIYNNVTLWADNTKENEDRFWNAINHASLTEFVLSLKEKENTSLGDYGMLISGGQKQRISIARELFKNAEILILDEATSSLDTETEKIIQENIEALHGKYTMIIIAHRLSTIKNADHIYLLEKGRISASGKFDKMIEVSSRFKRMVELQEF